MAIDTKISRPLTVAIANSDPQYRAMLAELFVPERQFRLLDDPDAAMDAVAVIERDEPDILLLASSGHPHEVPGLLERIQNTKGNVKAVLLVSDESQDFFVRAVRAGVRGILHRDSAPDLLLKCIRKVSEGELWLDRATTAQVLRQFTEEHPQQRPRERDAKTTSLSPREREIVGFVVQGYKNRELAEKLVISEQTVKNHMHNIFDKLGVSDRLELTLYAIHNNLLKPEA